MTADALLDAFEAAWTEHDAPAFERLCTQDVHYEDPTLDEPLTGPAELGRHASKLWTGFPDLRVQSTGPRMTNGRHITAPLKLLGHHRGELEGLPATERFVVVQAVVVAELHPDEDLLWRIRPFFDGYGAAVELGLLPPRGSMGERALLMLRGFGLRASSRASRD